MPWRNVPHARAPGDAAERDRLPRAIAARLARHGWVTTAYRQATAPRETEPARLADADDPEAPGRKVPGR